MFTINDIQAQQIAEITETTIDPYRDIYKQGPLNIMSYWMFGAISFWSCIRAAALLNFICP